MRKSRITLIDTKQECLSVQKNVAKAQKRKENKKN